MAKAVLITGSNMGDAAGNVSKARAMIAAGIGAITAQSAVEESEPWGSVESADDAPARFMNQVLVVETGLTPHALLDKINYIERSMGRVRNDGSSGEGDSHAPCCGRNGEGGGRVYASRTMDIDILFYDDAAISDERLTIPHPLICEREFVLAPLAEVMPGYTHPSYGRSIAQLLEELRSRSFA